MSKTAPTEKEVLELINEYGHYRDVLEEYLWNEFINSKGLTRGRYVIYFNTLRGKFSTYFLDDKVYMPCKSDLIFIMRLDGSEWESLHNKYNETKRWVEENGNETHFTFDEWIENEVKRDYINDAIDLIIETLESRI